MTIFSLGTDIFVHISNSMIYKTKIEDIRNTKMGVEYFVRFNACDCPPMRWLYADK